MCSIRALLLVLRSKKVRGTPKDTECELTKIYFNRIVPFKAVLCVSVLRCEREFSKMLNITNYFSARFIT